MPSVEAGEPAEETSADADHESILGDNGAAGIAAQGQPSEKSRDETSENDTEEAAEAHDGSEGSQTEDRSVERQNEASSEERQEEAGQEHESDPGVGTGLPDGQSDAWKAACIGVINILEEQGSGACVIDPNSPDGHRCGYDYCLFLVPDDPFPELYYRSVVSTLGEGIYRFADGTATEISRGDSCAAILTGAGQILCEGDAATLLTFLEP